MNEYCLTHEDGAPCKLTNRRKANRVFCEMICNGDWEKHREEDVEVLRCRHRKPLSDIKINNDPVIVIIPCCCEKTWMIQRTVDSLLENARGPVEIYVVYDGEYGEHIDGATVWRLANRVGQRVIVNMVVSQTTGKYIFRMDGHCLMSEGWDVRMKESCGNHTTVSTILDSLDDEMKPKGMDNGFVYIKPDMSVALRRGWTLIPERKTEEETMATIGTAYMMTRDDWQWCEGLNEEYGNYGGIGAELALKFWLKGGRVIIRTDVVCYHYFRLTTPFKVNITQKTWAMDKLYSQYVLGENKTLTKPFEWLLCKFNVAWPRRNYAAVRI